MPKISICNIKTQCSYDVKLIDNIIKDMMDSFLQGLFQFCHVCEQLQGWMSATYMIFKNTATIADVASNNNDDESNANKWHTMMINLFKDFEKIF